MAISKDGESAVRDEYLKKVLERARETWCEDNGVDEKWLAIQSATAEDVLGRAGQSQPNWFRDAMQELKPLLNLRDVAYSRWLGTGKQEDLIRFKEARSEARRSARKAKNAWFQEKAEEIVKEWFVGKKVWKIISDMQRGRRGLIPSRAVTICDEDGAPCVSTSDQHQHGEGISSKCSTLGAGLMKRK